MEQCLKDYIKGEKLRGENAYFCEKCNKKVNALKKDTFKFLPNYMILVLSRFDYNYEIQQRYKINDYFKYPRHLDLRKYTKFKDIEEEKMKTDFPNIDDNYFNFDLNGVVVHNGFASSGHYYSLIKD